MARKIFLDVGAHLGETLEEVVKDEYLFDIIHCFEPMKQPFTKLKKRFDRERFAQYGQKDSHPKIFYHNFGLSDSTAQKTIYGSGAGASIFSNKGDINSKQSQKCDFLSASQFFRQNLTKEDVIIVKLNCEGAEILILRDLLRSGEIFKINNVMIDFDAVKIPSLKTEPTILLEEMKRADFRNYALCRGVMRGATHSKRIANWLNGLDIAAQIIKNPPHLAKKIYIDFQKWRNLMPLKDKG